MCNLISYYLVKYSDDSSRPGRTPLKNPGNAGLSLARSGTK